MFALGKIPSGSSALCSMSFLIHPVLVLGLQSCGTEQPPAFQDGTVQRLDDPDSLSGADAQGEGRETHPGHPVSDLMVDAVPDERASTTVASGGVTGPSEDDAELSKAGSVRFDEEADRDTQNSPDSDEDDAGSEVKSAGTNFNPEVMTVNKGTLYGHTLSLTQADAAKVDILWVIDSSGSMQRAQEYLGANMNSFITGLAESHQDFQAAITTTDICSDSYPDLNRPCPELAGYSGSPATNLRGRFVGDAGRKILKNTDADLIARFNSYAQVGTTGSGWEHGLKATEMAVSRVLSGENDALIREGSFLSVIIVSDEEDDGTGLSMPEGYLGGYNPTEDGDTTFSFTNDELIDYLDGAVGKGHYSVSAITRIRNDQGDICNYADTSIPDPHREEGAAYIEVAEKTGGIIQSICEEDWSENLQTMGQDLGAQISQISLNAPPEADSIKVFVNDESVSGWVWLEGPNTVKFNQDSIPAPGVSIRVEFASKVR